jgi:hypothetical protein
MFTIQAHGIPPFIAPEGPYFGRGLSEAQSACLQIPVLSASAERLQAAARPMPFSRPLIFTNL